jgi:ABC-2 type transport system permease protein/ribosome-dependent ATPase
VSLARAWAVARKEWREIVRDRLVFLLAFLLAPLLMLVLGYGLSQDVEHVPTAILDEDRTPSSRDYARHFVDSRYFHVRSWVPDRRAADRLLADGAVRLVLVIPAGFHERLAARRTAEVQALIDGTFTRTARTVQSYVEAINADVDRDLRAAWVAATLGVPRARADVLLEPLRVEVRYLYNQELRSRWGVVPSMTMLVLTLVVPLLVALNVVREKETGAIYNVYASTITRAEYLAGKLLPNVVIGAVNVVILWAVAVAVFGVPFKGDLAAYLGTSLLYVLAASAAGLLISVLVRTQQAALTISVILSTIVAIQFSGMITPLASLTGLTWLVARALPPSHYNTIVQAAFLKGAGAAALWRDAAVFVVHAVAGLGLAWLLFHKRTRA